VVLVPGLRVPVASLTNGQVLAHTDDPHSFLTHFTNGVSHWICSYGCGVVIRANIVATNGYVHIINTSPKSAIDHDAIAGEINHDSSFTIFSRWINVTGLSPTFNAVGFRCTFFAVPDIYIRATLTAAKQNCLTGSPAGIVQLRKIVEYHAIRGVVYPSFLMGLGAHTTVEGSAVSITSLGSGRFAVNGKTMIDLDNFGLNGVVQIVNGLLIPPGTLTGRQLMNQYVDNSLVQVTCQILDINLMPIRNQQVQPHA